MTITWWWRDSRRAVPESTDAEIFWLVHPDAVEGKDYDPEKLDGAVGHHDPRRCVARREQSCGHRIGRLPGRPICAQQKPGRQDFIAWYMNEVVQT